MDADEIGRENAKTYLEVAVHAADIYTRQDKTAKSGEGGDFGADQLEASGRQYLEWAAELKRRAENPRTDRLVTKAELWEEFHSPSGWARSTGSKPD